MKSGLHLRQAQGLVMTPQMRQAIALLQLSNLELSAVVAEEVERNPLLDLDESRTAPGTLPSHRTDGTRGSGGTDIRDDDGIARVAEQKSLREHLLDQLAATVSDPVDRLVGAHLIGSLDDAGYLRADVADISEELGADPADVARILYALRGFEPVGVFARDLADCLAMQLSELNRLDPAMRKLLDNLDVVARGDRPALRRICAIDDEDLGDMLEEIRSLDPKPGLAFGGATAPLAVPDVIVERDPSGGWKIELNADTLPRLIINNAYRTHVSGRGRRDERAYVQECFQSANWIIRALHQRSETVLKVAAEIVRRQSRFLEKGVSALVPLTLREVAGATGLHESTVSRATSNKYVATPRGTFGMRFFFTTAVARRDGGQAESATAVKQRIRDLVAAEDPAQAHSDDRIVALLRQEGIDLARRTVAKYREALGIGSSTERRRAARLRGK